MNRIPKEKRNQIVLVALIILLVLAGLWFTLISYQRSRLARVYSEQVKRTDELAQIKNTQANSKQIEAALASTKAMLASWEADMATGDYYSSMVSSILKFKSPYKIEMPQFSPSEEAEAMSMLPRFPYKQFTLSVAGTGGYFDIGKFIADFENAYPSSRILNLELTPSPTAGPEDKEKLSFRMEIVSLVKSSETSPAKKKP